MNSKRTTPARAKTDRAMPDDLERGDDLKTILEGDWLILWDGTPEGWLRCRDAPALEDWR